MKLRALFLNIEDNPPNYLEDYPHQLLPFQQLQQPTGLAYPISSVLSYDNCNAAYKNFCLTI